MSDDMKIPRVSREHFSVVPLDHRSDEKYWQSRSVEERLEHLELLRRINYGDAAAGRLQRVFEVGERRK